MGNLVRRVGKPAQLKWLRVPGSVKLLVQNKMLETGDLAKQAERKKKLEEEVIKFVQAYRRQDLRPTFSKDGPVPYVITTLLDSTNPERENAERARSGRAKGEIWFEYQLGGLGGETFKGYIIEASKLQRPMAQLFDKTWKKAVHQQEIAIAPLPPPAVTVWNARHNGKP